MRGHLNACFIKYFICRHIFDLHNVAELLGLKSHIAYEIFMHLILKPIHCYYVITLLGIIIIIISWHNERRSFQVTKML